MSKLFNTSGKAQFFLFLILISLLVFSSGCVLPSGNNSPDNHNSPRFTAISAGGDSGLALRSDGKVLCWGSNRDGFCEIPRNLTDVKAIFPTNFAVKKDGTVAAWGDPDLTPVVPSNLTHVVAITRISYHCLALRDDGGVVIWRLSDPPQLARQYSDEQVAIIKNLSDLTSISRYYGLKNDGTVVTWLDMENPSSPVVPGLSNIVAISDWGGNLVALRDDGTVAALKTVSSDIKGKLKFVPIHGVENLSDIRSVSAGFGHILFLKHDGTVISWANGSVQSTGLTDIRAISASDDWDLALKKDGSIVASGDNTYGQLFTPGKATSIRAISTGFSTNILLKNNGTIITWGEGLRDLCCVHGHEPAGIDNVTGILATEYQYYILENNETVYGWGDEELGPARVTWIPHQYLRLFSGGNSLFALKDSGNLVLLSRDAAGYDISSLENVTGVSSELGYAVTAVKNDGTVVVLGKNGSASSEKTGNLSGVTMVSVGGHHVLALKTDGTVIGWGDTMAGKALDIPLGLSDVTSISSGEGYSLALRRNGTVVAWGLNFRGQCDVPENLHDIVAISAGDGQSLALKKDGTVVAWGKTVIPDWNG